MDNYEIAGRLHLSGENTLGAEQAGSHASYLVCGGFKAGERGRMVNPGKGCEEIVLGLRGNLFMRGRYAGVLKLGDALHLGSDDPCFIDNPGNTESVYVIARGHAEGGHC